MFSNTEYFWLLLIIPIYIIATLYFRKIIKARLTLFSSQLPKRNYKLDNIRLAIHSIFILLIIFALARPKFGNENIESKSEGISMAIALDLSNSMRAEDVAPNRLQRAKIAIERILQELGNNKIALIGFAQKAILISPLSNDINAIQTSLDIIDENFLQNQGTNISEGIDLSIETLSKEPAQYKAILLISDGEEFEGSAVSSAENASKDGCAVFAISIGSQNGAPIPIKNGNQNEFLKDENGNLVITKANDKALNEIAKAGNGIFSKIGDSDNNIEEIINAIGQMKKQEFKTSSSNQFAERFQLFIALAILLFISEIFIEKLLKIKRIQK